MEIYVQQFIIFILLFLRFASMIIAAPMFGHQNVPLQIKAALSVFLAFVMYALVQHTFSLGSITLISLVLLGLKEIAAGLAIGFMMTVIFAGIRYAGDLIGIDMGFSMAMMYDQENNASFPVLGELLYLFLLMIFLLLNGHHFMLEALLGSYAAIPIGTWVVTESVVNQVVAITGQIFIIAVKIAAPILVSLFLANISLGILNKVMPQMNIFGIIFSLKITVGMIVLSATIPVIVFVFKKMLTVFETSIIELIRMM